MTEPAAGRADDHRALRRAAAMLRLVKSPMLVLRAVNASARGLNRSTYHAQYLIEWGVPPRPEWYDHQP